MYGTKTLVGLGEALGEGLGDGFGEGLGDGLGDGLGEGVSDGLGDEKSCVGRGVSSSRCKLWGAVKLPVARAPLSPDA